MTTMGACLIANELSPIAQELIQMRIEGKSWAQIAEHKGLGSPSAARKLFTKETGLTDYKIKGETMKALLEMGYDTKQTAAKINALVKEVEEELTKAPTFTFHAPSTGTKATATVAPETTSLAGQVAKDVEAQFNTKSALVHKLKPGDKFVMKNAGKQEVWVFDSLADKETVNGLKYVNVKNPDTGKVLTVHPKSSVKKIIGEVNPLPPSQVSAVAAATPSLANVSAMQQAQVIAKYSQGSTYTQIVNSTGLTFADVDQIVWNDLLKKNGGSVVQAWNQKKTSEAGIQSVRDYISKRRAAGHEWKAISEDFKLQGVSLDIDQLKALATKDIKTLAQPGAINSFKAYVGPSYTQPQTFGDVLPKITGSKEYPLFGEKGALDWHQLLGNDLPYEQLEALRTYTGSAYVNINTALRNNVVSGHYKDLIDNMDKGMRALPKDVTLIRRTGYDAFEGLKDFTGLEGKAFTDDGYLSTAVKEGVWHGSVEMEIHAPAGTMARYVNPFSRNKGEMEVILGRGTEFVIEKVERRAGGGSAWRLTVRIISQQGRAI